jgi:2-(1,2-epoxy-1,2-dihydrophenyl)acetyl-CoA isomerase
MATAPQKQTQKENTIQEEKHGAVLTLRMNRPELNAFTTPMCRSLLHALLTAADDKSVRAIVLTGAGEAFSAGGDLRQIREWREKKAVKELEELLIAGKEICLAIATMPKLVIAAVNGVAAAGGMSLALACDLRIASQNAKFSQGFAQLGLYPDFGATYFLPRLIGLSRASELFYTGETLDASEACRIGIVYQVFESGKFEEETQTLAEHLAAGPPLAYRDVKRTMIGDKKREMEDALDEEIRLQSHCFTTEDCVEGLAAFFEKRKPNFRGF